MAPSDRSFSPSQLVLVVMFPEDLNFTWDASVLRLEQHQTFRRLREAFSDTRVTALVDVPRYVTVCVCAALMLLEIRRSFRVAGNHGTVRNLQAVSFCRGLSWHDLNPLVPTIPAPGVVLALIRVIG